MIWLVGNKGMLGYDVEKLLKKEGIPYIATDRDVDICDYQGLLEFPRKNNITALEGIINCSAYTAVDNAEDEEDKAMKINGEGAGNLAKAAKEHGAYLIHISTDYVFSGNKEGIYTEEDATGPIGAYGRTKLAGEERIREILPEHYILRTAWLYGKNNRNFVYTMLDLFKKLDKLKVVADQWGTPTYTVDLAGAIVSIIKNHRNVNNDPSYGIYHFTNEGRINWHQFAAKIYEMAGELKFLDKKVEILPISTEEFPTKASRPANSHLSKEKIKKSFNITIRQWDEALKEFLQEAKKSQ